MAGKNKYYVVWSGRKKGVFASWNECKASIDGFSQARFKSFDTKKEAEQAFNNPYYDYFKTSGDKQLQDKSSAEKTSQINKNDSPKYKQINPILYDELPITDSLCVDAACSGNPGVMEYRGVHILTGKQIFYYKHPHGTNNIGEFLALVHGLSYLKRYNLKQPLYTDSINALKWVRQKKCKTQLQLNKKTEDLFAYIHRAEQWLQTNTYTTEIIKWKTELWGEIPADFGRKH